MKLRDSLMGAALAAMLAACGNPAATPERETETAASATESASEASSPRAANDDDRDEAPTREAGGAPRDDAPTLAETHRDGTPSWASNRRNSAAQAAQNQFERNGSDFAARDRQAYIDAAHAFIRNPPEGVLTASRRNGDRLMYDPAGNVFLVATLEGAPRTMFKPEEGMAYWREQEQRLAEGGGGGRRQGRGAADG